MYSPHFETGFICEIERKQNHLMLLTTDFGPVSSSLKVRVTNRRRGVAWCMRPSRWRSGWQISGERGSESICCRHKPRQTNGPNSHSVYSLTKRKMSLDINPSMKTLLAESPSKHLSDGPQRHLPLLCHSGTREGWMHSNQAGIGN